MTRSGSRLRGVCIGTGYFSAFHYDAWKRIPEVEIVACCSLDREQAERVASQYGIPRTYTDYREMLDAERPEFVDVITPPATHRQICEEGSRRGHAIICQKPLAPSLDEALRLVQACQGVRLMVHENFRFQPWHREIKRLLEDGAIGDQLHGLTFRSRPGDGYGEDAYLGRQPYFRDMERFLIFETGIHFIDTFRFLAGDVSRVTSLLRKLNPVIAGEDAGLLIFEFDSGAVGLWDANRCNELPCNDPRYTFGEFLVEGNRGSIRLDLDGNLYIKPLGEAERPHDYTHEKRGFGGDCVYFTQRHFVDRLLDGKPFETAGAVYLENLRVQEALYRSATERRTIDLATFDVGAAGGER